MSKTKRDRLAWKRKARRKASTQAVRARKAKR